MTRLEIKFFRFLPRAPVFSATKVTAHSRVGVDRAQQVQIANDGAWTQVKVLLDNGEHVGVSATVGGRAVRVDVDRERFRHTDGIRHLEQAATRQTGRHHALRHPARRVRRRTIHFRWIFATEGTATVRTPTAVRVDNDFTASDTSITFRSALHEATRRVQVENCVVIDVFGWNGGQNEFFELGANDVVGDVRRVLCRDEDGVHALWHDGAAFFLVLNGHLCFVVWQQPLQLFALALLLQGFHQFLRQHQSQWHQLWSLISGISKHVTLITGTNIQQVTAFVHTLRNLWRLLFNGNKHVTRVGVKRVR
mmetsp:Transcript_1628/g.2780  ORF Transcript_1628/g.2780 Transcript_1628/m.2780 type:complete len:308 (+) Transcript_1628:98-1021(+)